MKPQRGSTLMVMLLIVGALGAFVAVRALNGLTAERDRVTAAALAQAKEALIGYAATYRDTHVIDANGYLLLPDLGSPSRNTTPGEGVTAGPFTLNALNLSVVGRLPWKTLGLAALRDSQGECLWYAVSGSYQDQQKNPLMNWDTLGQFDTYTSNGTSAGTINTVGTNEHQRPVAVIFAPGIALSGQVRGTIGADVVTECGGNYDAQNYLDSLTSNPLINNIVNYLAGTNNATSAFSFATPKQLLAGPVVDTGGNILNNDRMLTITPDDLFRVIKKRSDFSGFVTNELLASAAAKLPTLSASLNRPVKLDFTPPAPIGAVDGDTVGILKIGRVPVEALTSIPSQKWQDNLFYAKCASGSSCLTVNGLSCSGVVIFAGERTPAQIRASNAQKNTWSNYLEGSVLTAFTTGSSIFTGPTTYSTTSPSSDVLACIVQSTPTQVSFAADLGSFVIKGSGVSIDSVAQTVTMGSATGSSGGCFWSPIQINLASKTLRAYYEFEFTNSDASGGNDRGNGFSLSLVNGNIQSAPPTLPPTYIPPTTCGTQANMGVLGGGDLWGSQSIIVEADVHRDNADNDPAENHTAIMSNGNIDHTGPGDTLSTACDGSATGCRHSPANKFEESPLQPHNQRTEIHTGCNATCSVCDPTAHFAPNTYARITTWVDCISCNDTATDINRLLNIPNIQRCIALNPALNKPFFGFTGGFRSGASQQGVTLKNLVLRSE